MDGAEVSWANFMALFVCALLEMLIGLCEALDARAAAEVARLVAAPASRDGEAASIPALRAAKRQAPSSERRAPQLALAPKIQATTPKPDDAPSRTTERPTPAAARLVWSRDPGPIRAVPSPPWRPRRETRASTLPLSTSMSLQDNNYNVK